MSSRYEASGVEESVCYVDAAEVAQIALQGRVRPVLDPGNQRLRRESIRMILGAHSDDPKPCVGECGILLLGFTQWQRLEKADRNRLRCLGVNRTSSYGRCWKCAERGVEKGESGRKHYAPKITDEIRARIPEMWAGIQDAGGGFRVLGEHLGVSTERARQLVKELELPHRDTRGVQTQEFLEELEFLAGFQLGAHELAQRFGMTARSLVERIDRLRARGLTTVSFPNYFEGERDAA